MPRGIAGNHYLFVKADSYKIPGRDEIETLAENNDENNEARILDTLLIRLNPAPDLQVTDILPPGNVFSGQDVTLTYTVTNLGDGETEPNSRWRDAIYITDSESTSEGDFLKNIYRSGIFDVDSSYTQTTTVTLPEGIFGDYYFYVVTDAFNQVYEYAFEENNRTLSEATNVILTPPIDLAVTRIETETVASNNENVVIRWEVTNQGGSSVLNTSWVDKVYLSATPEFEQVESLGSFSKSVTDLRAGESYSSQITVTIPDEITGPYYVFVRTDASNRVYEYLYEVNDTRSDSTLVVQNADLVVTTFNAPETFSSGESIVVDWTVKNNGPGSILGKSWTDVIGLVPDDGSDAIIRIGSLPRNGTMSPGDSLFGGILVTIPEDLSGDYQLMLQIDGADDVYEGTQEGNNTMQRSITVLPSPVPDLEITERYSVDTATAWDYIPVTFTIKNTGDTLITNTSWEDRIYLSPDSIWNPENARLIKQFPRSQEVLSGEGYTVTDSVQLPMLPSDVSVNTCYLYFYADGDSSIYERSNETNNLRRSDPIYVSAYDLPDFIISNMGIDDSISSGERTCVMWTTENSGNALISEAYAPWWYDGVYLSEDTIWDASDTFLWDWVFYQSDLDTGSYRPDMQFYDFPDGVEGDYFILMIADHTNRVDESDTTNNYLWKPLHVTLTPSPDLVITNLQVPSIAIAGQPLDFFWTIENQGAGPTQEGSYTSAIYLSRDLTLDEDDDELLTYSREGDLLPDDAVPDTLSVDLPLVASGNYILLMEVDYNNQIYEHEAEENNTLAIPLQIVLPEPSDLIVQGIALADTLLIAGEMVTLNWTIQNQGEHPASGRMKEAVYFSADTIIDPSDAVLIARDVEIYLPPQAEEVMTVRAPLADVALGNYYIIVETDLKDNIPEQNEANNFTVLNDPVRVDVQQLFLDQTVTETVSNGETTPLYYRLEVADSLEGETIQFSVVGDTIFGSNEAYVRYGEIPTRSVYDFTNEFPFEGTEAVYVPRAQSGTYYLYVYAGYTNPGVQQQEMELTASILPFAIRNVETNQGGNLGSVTVEIEGSRFERNMRPSLIHEYTQDTIDAYYYEYTDATSVFASFDLYGVVEGPYDVILATASGDSAIARGLFEVVSGSLDDSGGGVGGSGPIGSGGDSEFTCNFSADEFIVDQLLEVTYDYPSSTRPQRTIPIRIHYANGGNVDLPIVSRFFVSLEDAPIAYSVQELEEDRKELLVEFKELEGPQHVLRPGAKGTITVYTKAIGRTLRYRMIK